MRLARFIFVVLLLMGSLSLLASQSTPVYQGSGGTCEDAERAAERRAWQDVYLWCYYWNYQQGHCEADFIVTEPCSCENGPCTVSGYYSYSCVVGGQCGCEPSSPYC